jgi:AT hook motif.
MERFRVSVPSNDATVLEWIENQANLSYSFRVLVREYVREYGMTDATCMEVVPGGRKRGRPRKDLTDVIASAKEAEIDDSVEETEDVSATTETPATEIKKTKETTKSAKTETTTTAPAVSVSDDDFVDPDEFF